MVIVAAREIEEIAVKNGYRVIVTGVGAGALAGWIAYYSLKSKGYDAELIQGGILYGHSPRPADPFALSFSHVSTGKMLTDIIDGYGAIICGQNNKTIGILGAAQIDKYGNINTSFIDGKQYLIGAGGGNDIASGTREVVVVVRQSKRRFVDKVPYISSCGDRVTTVISNLGVFSKLEDEGTLVLRKYMKADSILSKDKTLDRIREQCGWDLEISEDAKQLPLPRLQELRILRMLDPYRLFIK